MCPSNPMRACQRAICLMYGAQKKDENGQTLAACYLPRLSSEGGRAGFQRWARRARGCSQRWELVWQLGWVLDMSKRPVIGSIGIPSLVCADKVGSRTVLEEMWELAQQRRGGQVVFKCAALLQGRPGGGSVHTVCDPVAFPRCKITRRRLRSLGCD